MYIPTIKTPLVPPQLVIPQEGMKILLVEDEPEVQRAFVRELKGELLKRAMNIKVITANDAPAALRLYRADPENIQGILSDIDMPTVDGIHDGFALYHALRRSPPTSNPIFYGPIILWTGRPEAHQVVAEELIVDGQTAFKKKPCSMSAIIDTFFTLWDGNYSPPRS